MKKRKSRKRCSGIPRMTPYNKLSLRKKIETNLSIFCCLALLPVAYAVHLVRRPFLSH